MYTSISSTSLHELLDSFRSHFWDHSHCIFLENCTITRHHNQLWYALYHELLCYLLKTFVLPRYTEPWHRSSILIVLIFCLVPTVKSNFEHFRWLFRIKTSKQWREFKARCTVMHREIQEHKLYRVLKCSTAANAYFFVWAVLAHDHASWGSEVLFTHLII